MTPVVSPGYIVSRAYHAPILTALLAEDSYTARDPHAVVRHLKDKRA